MEPATPSTCRNWLGDSVARVCKTTLTMLALLASTSSQAQTIVISRGGSRAVRPGPAGNFTGEVRVEMLSEALAP